MIARRYLLAVLVTLLGCGDDGETATTPPPPPPPTCEAPEIAVGDGLCIRPGVQPDGCAEGFEHDGEYACVPVLPAEPCPPGEMALPGEASCRPVMDCGTGTWGDIPVEGNTVYVDASFSGTSNGSAQAPWTSVADAVADAQAGAIIAIAEGSYADDPIVSVRPVRLWGVCPQKVELVGSAQPRNGCPSAALCINGATASGTEVRGIAMRSGALGLTIAGAQNVLVDRVWVHDTAGKGVDIEAPFGATSVTLTDSLVESAHDTAVFVIASDAVVERTVIRDTLPYSDQTQGRGLSVHSCSTLDVCDQTVRGSATVRSSVIERNTDVGVFVSGSDLVMEASVVRDTVPRALDQRRGRGIAIQTCRVADGCEPLARASFNMLGSVVERNHDIALFVGGADATVDSSVLRDTLPQLSDQLHGAGVAMFLLCPSVGDCDASTRTSGAIRNTLIDNHHDTGVIVSGADVSIESAVVRGSLAVPADGTFGDGVAVSAEYGAASLAIEGSLVDGNERAGLANFAALAAVGSSMLSCSAFDITGVAVDGVDASFEDRGGNLCGCPATDTRCKAVSSDLSPPAPIADSR